MSKLNQEDKVTIENPVTDITNDLNGCEVDSISQEGVVGINNGKFYMNGNELKLSNDAVLTLWDEYVENELG